MKIILWKGFHSPTLPALIGQSLLDENLLILCPPYLKGPDFLDYLPKGTIELLGQWSPEERAEFEAKAANRKFCSDYPQLPDFGIFSSGTLSLNPRLALFRLEQARASLEAIFSLFEDIKIEKIFCYPQPFHIFGFTLGYLQSLIYRRPMVALGGKYQQGLHDRWLNETDRGMLTLGAPVHFRDLLSIVAARKANPDPSESCIIGGAPVSRELWMSLQQTLHIELPSIGYGATEACPGLSHLPPGICPQSTGEIGTWLKNVDIEIVPGKGYYFSGPNQCTAIVDTAADPAVRFPERIFIADEIEIRPTGTLAFRGRSDWKLNRGAEKHSLEAIEHELEKRLNTNVVALALPDIRLGETLGIIIVDPFLNDDLSDRVIDCVKTSFGWNIRREEILSVNALPLSFNGKVDRRQCMELFAMNHPAPMPENFAPAD